MRDEVVNFHTLDVVSEPVALLILEMDRQTNLRGPFYLECALVIPSGHGVDGFDHYVDRSELIVF